MAEFFPDAPDYRLRPLVEVPVEDTLSELKKLLPELPEQISIWLDSRHMIPDTGSGGFAYAPDIINISFDEHFPDKAEQLKYLRGTIFHEGYHLVQGHTYERPVHQYKTALENAVYEGCATVFEREYAQVSPLWGDYSRHSDAQLSEWQEVMAQITKAQYEEPGSKLYPNWAFYDPTDKQRWKMYKTGAWIVDRVLKKSEKDIRELRHLSAQEILSICDEGIEQK